MYYHRLLIDIAHKTERIILFDDVRRLSFLPKVLSFRLELIKKKNYRTLLHDGIRNLRLTRHGTRMWEH